MATVPATYDRGGHAGLVQNPGDRDLGYRRAQSLGDRAESVGNRKAALDPAGTEQALVEARFDPWTSPGCKSLLWRRASEDPARERLVDGRWDPKLAASRDRRPVREVIDQIQPDLDDINRSLRMAA